MRELHHPPPPSAPLPLRLRKATWRRPGWFSVCARTPQLPGRSFFSLDLCKDSVFFFLNLGGVADHSLPLLGAVGAPVVARVERTN